MRTNVRTAFPRLLMSTPLHARNSSTNASASAACTGNCAPVSLLLPLGCVPNEKRVTFARRLLTMRTILRSSHPTPIPMPSVAADSRAEFQSGSDRDWSNSSSLRITIKSRAVAKTIATIAPASTQIDCNLASENRPTCAWHHLAF